MFVPVLVGCLETIFYTGITAIPTGPGVADIGPVINVVGYLVIGRAHLVNEVNKSADGRSAVLTELDHVVTAHFCNGVMEGIMVFIRNGRLVVHPVSHLLGGWFIGYAGRMFSDHEVDGVRIELCFACTANVCEIFYR